ncbi:MAG: ATP-binding protein [Planktothrix sp. GU0601_MAG3]|nr:MAG: ATP-binding protein [Planktothrix sp. GU0601_MAG3]
MTQKRLISIAKDPLIQHALLTKELFWWPVQELSTYTRQWFTSTVDKILVMTLHTAAEHHPTGLLIIADPEQIQTEFGISLTMFNSLVMQFSWSRRYLRIQEVLKTQHEELQWMNWYKQRRLEELYRTVGGGLKQLNELNQSPFQSTDPQKTQLSHLRYQQLLRQMGSALASTSSLIKQEQWRLHHQNDIIPIANLLRRVRERINAIIRNKQIQLVVKQQENFNVVADNMKLELVFYEILLNTCHRAEPGGIIEITTQPLNDRQLELIITDYGTINPQLILELKAGQSPDLLAPSCLASPPGQQLLICQQMLEKMAGKFLIEQGENQQIITRIILTLAPTT